MNKITVIAWREFLATVRTRAFLIGIVLMPLMMTVGLIVGAVARRLDDQGERTFAVIDRTPGAKVLEILQEAAQRRNANDVFDRKTKARTAALFILEPVAPEDDAAEQRFALSQRVRKGEIVGFLDIGPSATEPAALRDPDADPLRDPATTRYQARPNAPGAMEFFRWAAVEVALVVRLGAASQKPEMRRLFLDQKVPVVLLGLSSRDPATGQVVDDEGAGRAVARIAVGVGCVLLMFAILFTVATPLMQGVLEEKMQRIAEVLLGSVTPFELMAGKLIGGVGVALVLAAVYLAGAFAGLYHYGMTDQVPASLVGWFVFYQLLALLMYGSLFLAVGAACTDMKEPQTLLLPVMLPAMIPLFLLGPILSHPDGALARGASFFPPCTPMLMVARLALSANVAWWEPVVASGLVLGFTAFCVWVAGRIFRVGILVQGKGATVGQMVRWVLRGE